MVQGLSTQISKSSGKHQRYTKTTQENAKTKADKVQQQTGKQGGSHKDPNTQEGQADNRWN